MKKILEYAKKKDIRLFIEQDTTYKLFIYTDKISYSKIAELIVKRNIKNKISWILTDYQTEYTNKEPALIQLGYAKKTKKRFWAKKKLNEYKNIYYINMNGKATNEELEAVNNLSITDVLPEHVNIYDGKIIYYKR